jgi:DNA gyrase subunit A
MTENQDPSIEIDSQTDASPETQSSGDADLMAMIDSISEEKYGKIKHISISNEMEKSYLDYAMSVIVSRALPDVRDGLKPVHRRILYSMYRSGTHHTSSYRKSATTVGNVLGKFHPHGDAPVYMALVRLAQDFSMRYPLIDGQGNFGSVDGDSPAAMRYTEARLAKMSKELLADLEKKTVGFVDNFDGTTQEPVVLPTRLPNLLLMGSEGIAVGMATKIPPHNLGEVCKAVLAMIEKGSATSDVKIAYTPHKDPSKLDVKAITAQNALIDDVLAKDPHALAGNFDSEITIDEIMEEIHGPDFPTGGIIYDFKTIKEAYHTGRGKVVIRAKASIEETSKGGFQIVVTEIPYQVNKARLIMKIADLVRNKKIEGIKDLNDDSDRKGMQITIELKRDAQPKVVLNKLFKYSELQTSFPMNMVALTSDGTPLLMNIKQILMEYIAHRQLVIVRRSQFDLREARARGHILEGLLIALNNLDEVIETIRKSADTDAARAALMKKFGLSELQSNAILEMQLKRLAALERQKIEDEYKAIQLSIDALIKLLSQPKSIIGVIAKETQEMIDGYADERRTRLIKSKIGEFNEEDLIASETTVITMTQTGYVKRYSPSALRSQQRGGKGSIGITTKEEDAVKNIFTANTHDTLLLFTNKGRVFKLKVYDIPESSRQAKGTAVVNLINLKGDETVQSAIVLNEERDKESFITLATRDGLVKKTAVKLYDNIRQNGIIAIILKDNDQLVWGKVTTGADHIMLITHHGKSIRFSEKEVKNSNRDTQGVKGIELLKDDFVVGVEAFSPEIIEGKTAAKGAAASNSTTATDGKKMFHQLMLMTEKGIGKRTELNQYPVQKRAGQGVKVAEITAKTGNVIAAMMVTQEHEELVITTQSGQMIKLPIDAKSIPVLSRPTQGVILMRPKAGDKVAAVALTYSGEYVPALESATDAPVE